MAYQYSGWRLESTAESRLRMLDQHMTEVSELISANVTKGASSRDVSPLNQYLDGLREERKRVAVLAGREARGGLRPVRFG